MSAIDFLKGIVSQTAKLSKSGFRLWKTLLDGDFNQKDLDAFLAFGKEALESQDEAVEIVKLQALLAASIATGQVLTWVDKGGLAPLLNSEVAKALAPVVGAFNTIAARVEKEEKRIKGILDNAALQRSVENIRRFHRIASIISPEYRTQIANWNDNVRGLSREVFGDVSTLNSGLALVQMAVYDLTDARGDGVDIAQNDYFKKALQVTDEVERRSRRYARNPGEFWYYLNHNVLDGLFTARVYQTTKAERALGDVTGLLTRTDERVTQVTKRFDEYRAELGPFLTEEKLIEIDAIRRDFNKDIRTPLGELTTFFEEEFPEIEEELLAIDLQATATANSLLDAEIVTTNPDKLTEKGKAKQRDRYNSIFRNIMALGETGYTDLNLAMERQDSLYKAMVEGDND